MSSSDDDTLASDEPQTWDDWEEEEEGGDEAVKSLFSDATLPSPEAAFEHDLANFSFDLRDYKRQAGLDDYGVIKCVNYIRSEVAGGRDPLPALKLAVSQASKPWDGDKYLQPVLPDDVLLFYDFDEGLEGDSNNTGMVESSRELQALREENESLRFLLSELSMAALPEELRQPDAAAEADSSEAGPSNAGPSSSTSHQPSMAQDTPAADPTMTKRVDQTYFESYSYFDIHREMLGDKPRTETYRQALECNPELLKGSTVLDVGCGTAILSMFAARGGASKVVGVDGSERIASVAKQVLKANQLGADEGGPISIVAGKLEDLTELPVNKVDVIVSEWMGYALLFETMLETVLYARDRYLRPGGAVLPDIASIYIAAAGEGATGLNFWKDVYGFSMEPIRSTLLQSAVNQAVVGVVEPQHIISEPALVQELDMCAMTPSQQDFSSTFKLVPKAPSTAPGSQPPADSSHCHSIVLWFDTHFSERFCKQKAVTLSTSPFQPTTHWAQTILTLRTPIPTMAGSSSSSSVGCPEITGRLSMVRSTKHRSLDISLEYQATTADGQVFGDVLLYHMDIHASGSS